MRDLCGGDVCINPNDPKMMGERIDAAERERDSLRAQLAEMREALEKMMGASRYAHETGDLSPVPEAYNRCEELLARNDTGRDLLERVRYLEQGHQSIDALLKDTPAPFTGVEPFEATVSLLNCDGYKKGGGEDA